MSRIGKQPITIPDGVTATLADRQVTIKGKLGELTFDVPADIGIEVVDSIITCQPKRTAKGGKGKHVRSLWGTTRARLANMVEGVSAGFTKELEIQGVGYKASIKGKNLELALGFSHPVVVVAPDGITFEVEKEIIKISGPDKVLVGQIAADIRAWRKPEPYKGKGLRYVGEHVRRKVGKVVGATSD
jgi:large subunit ribosomal protein L6